MKPTNIDFNRIKLFFWRVLFYSGLLITLGCFYAVKNFSITAGAFCLTGISLIVLSTIMIRKIQISQSQSNIMEGPPKEYSERIPVDLTLCELHCNEFQSEENRQRSSMATMLDSINYSEKNIIRQKHSLIRLRYKFKYNGNEKTFISETIHADIDQVRWSLETHKKTLIYVNPRNPEQYYFDVRLLNETGLYPSKGPNPPRV